ncbi:MAG: hypothetical protein HC927_02900 [Deltaproteobacteria bacterium]|nr:hypothetical protein [Deltaproteobacteria bacterium]
MWVPDPRLGSHPTAGVVVGGPVYRHCRPCSIAPTRPYFDQAVKRPERIFLTGSTWLTFESGLPGREVCANSMLEPAIGISGDLALRTFANAEWQNWISSQERKCYVRDPVTKRLFETLEPRHLAS